MAERYRNQIQQRDVPAAFGKNFVDPESMGANVWKAFAGVGVAAAELGAKIHERNEKIKEMQRKQQEKQQRENNARAKDAQNQYKKQMNEKAKETKAQEKANAKNATQEMNEYSDQLASQISEGLDNEEQKNQFMSGLEGDKEAYVSQAATHEAEQMVEYETEVYEEGLEVNAESVAQAPDDEATWNANMDSGMSAIQQRFPDATPKQLQQMGDRYASGMDSRRITSIAGGDVRRAYEEAQKSQFLTAKDRTALLNKLAPEIKKIEVQEMTEALIQKFPPEQQSEGLKYIHKNLSGSLENDVIGSYKSRISELKSEQSDIEAERKKVQKENFAKLRTSLVADGQLPTYSELTDMLDNESISREDYNKALEWSQAKADRRDAIKHLQRIDPNWSSYRPAEQESRIMRFMGKTEEQRKETLDFIQRGVLDGSVTDADIDTEYTNGNITRSEMQYYKAFDNKMKSDQTGFAKAQGQALKIEIDRTFPKGQYSNVKAYRDDAALAYSEKVSTLDPTSKSYRQDVMEARKEAYLQAVENSGRALERSTWFGLGGAERTRLGQRVDKVTAALEEALGNVGEYNPTPYKQDIDLTTPLPPGTRSGQTQAQAQVQAQTQPQTETPTESKPVTDKELKLDQNNKILVSPDGTPVLESRPSSTSTERTTITIPTDKMPSHIKNIAGATMLRGAKYRKSSGMNDMRDKGKRTHNAVDYAAPRGTPIRSANFGTPLTVKTSSKGDVTGNYITLEGTLPSGQKITVRVLHMEALSPLKPGDVVKAGDLIGRVGNTGRTSTGAHMHLDVSIDGVRVDPDKYLAMIQSIWSNQKPTSQPVTSGDVVSGDVTSGDAVSWDTASGDIVSDDVEPDYVEPEDAESEDFESDEYESEDDELDDDELEDDEWDEFEDDDVISNDIISGDMFPPVYKPAMEEILSSDIGGLRWRTP